MSKENKLSPIMQQYLDMQSENPGSVLLFRLGDFYEAFFGDAVRVAKALDLVLTHRGTDERGVDIPMCGIPWHAGDNYIGRLVKQGISVAIAEQMETPDEAKARGAKQLERKIVRVITAGTLTDENLLSPKKSNFLAAVAMADDGAFDIAAADISTGEFLIGKGGFDDIAKLAPAEVLFRELDAERPEIIRIRENFNAAPLHKFQYAGLGEGAAGEAVEMISAYLKRTQRETAIRLLPPKPLGGAAGLSIDAATWKSLEIDAPLNPGGGSLLDIIDRTKTAAGGRLLRTWIRNLLGDAEKITERQNHIGHLVINGQVQRDFAGLMGRIPDVGRSLARLGANRGMPRDIRAVLDFLKMLPDMKVAGSKLDNALARKFQGLELFDDLTAELFGAIGENLPAFFRDGGVIRKGYDAGLDAARDMAAGAKETIAGLQKQYAEKTGVGLKIKFNNIIGYYIEVAAKNAAPFMNPESGFIHRQTMSDNLRFTTAKLAELDSDVKNAGDRAMAIESKIVEDLICLIGERAGGILNWAEFLAEIDVYCAMATTAEEWNWTRPKIAKEPAFDVIGGRHPAVEKVLREHSDTFVKNDCGLDDKKVALLTGPNMSGKSTYLRQNALIVVLAHLGGFVPAERATIGIADQLFSRVGASDNLASGQSTFMVEMSETANILNRATEKSFIIFDEIGRGTATFDGMAIAEAVLEYTSDMGARCLFATHYHELTETRFKNVKNLTMKIAETGSEIVFLHKIIDGVANRSYGIHVAKMAGMPAAVLESAERILANLERGEKNEKEPVKPGQMSLF